MLKCLFVSYYKNQPNKEQHIYTYVCIWGDEQVDKIRAEDVECKMGKVL